MKRLLLIMLALCLTTTTIAQGEWFETGVLTGDIGGVQIEFHSYYTRVSDDAGEGIEDEAARDIAMRVAGTDQHTAWYRYADAIEMVGIVLSPARIWVTIQVRPDADQSVPGQLDIEFSLDPETLEMTDDDRTVRFFPERWALSNYYGLTEGDVVVTEIAENEDGSWFLSGHVTGVLSHQTSLSVEHNPADAKSIDVEFTIHNLAGR